MVNEMNAQNDGAVKVKTVEAKKTAPTSAASDMTTVSVVDYVGDIKGELKRISWPSQDELRIYTKIVVAMTFFLGMGIYFMDIIIQSVLSMLNLVFQWIS